MVKLWSGYGEIVVKLWCQRWFWLVASASLRTYTIKDCICRDSDDFRERELIS